MNLFNRSAVQKPVSLKTTLKFEQLEVRDVPSATVVDLTTHGASGSVNGALFQQYDSTHTNRHDLDSFLRLDTQGHKTVEQGYNTDARPLQFDELNNKANTQSIRVNSLPMVNIGGTDYREILLDINENRSNPKLSLDALQVFVSTSNKLHGYSNGRLANLTPVYDLDAHGDSWVKLDSTLNRGGGGDMLFYVRNDVLGDANNFLYLYSKFGAQGGKYAANGGFEEWAVGPSKPSPVTTFISGTIFNGPTGAVDTSGGTIAVSVNGDFLKNVTFGTDGKYFIDLSGITSQSEITLDVTTVDGGTGQLTVSQFNPLDKLSNQDISVNFNGD